MTSPCSRLLMFIRSELLPDNSSSDDSTTTPPTSSTTDFPHADPDHLDATQFASRRREKVLTFVSIPKELEKLMGYGFFQCADAFLYVFTFLPLRCCYALYKCVAAYFSRTPSALKASDKCELIKILILLGSSVVFMYIDTNVLYHVIKSQSVIKLYIFFNMLEVGDRLFGCFSQDTLDALFITATEQTSAPGGDSPPSSKKLSTPAHALICGVSILGHALVILLQSTTLSVAINANNRALLTVMMSNNFVELKGSVFKKFDKMNLFQVSCSDIRERFHLFVLLLIVCLQTLREYSWEESRFWVLLPDCLMVLLAEIVVDWLKHAFITRFNELPLQTYNNYTRSLAYDMAESVKRNKSKSSSSSFSCDYSDVVGRRLGFVPLPLAIVLIRVITPMFRLTSLPGLVVLSVVGYIALASFRILNTIVLVGKAVKIIDSHSFEQQQQCTTDNLLVKNSILKRTRTISGSDGDLLLAMKNENSNRADKKLTFVDLKEEEQLNKIHLMANSNVSLNSVAFNEEMLKVEERILGGSGDVLSGCRMGCRKHSLGSQLDDESVLLMMNRDSGCCIDREIKQEVKQEKVEDEGEEGEQQQQSGFDMTLDDTVIECLTAGTLKGDTVEQQEEVEQDSGGVVKLEDSGGVKLEDSGGVKLEDSGGVVKLEEAEAHSNNKKKKFNWFKSVVHKDDQ